DDPESRIRWGRVALVTVVSVASAGVIWSLLFTPGARTGGPVDVEAAGGTVVITAGESLPPLVDSPPPPPPGGTAAPGASPHASGPGATRPGAAVPTSSVPVVPPPTSSRPTASPTKTKNKTSSPTTNDGPNDPPPPPKTTSSPKTTSQPKTSSKPTTQPEGKQQASSAPPPPPPPPSFSAYGTVDVGYGREGIASIQSTAGTIQWSATGSSYVNASPASGTLGNGQSGAFRVTLDGLASGTSSDCDRQLSTYVTINWSGDNKGTQGSGSVKVTITYKKRCP
ncbi:hypothetical protein ABZU32_40180, partial [Sphaerisporangium sp. NPDC005288]